MLSPKSGFCEFCFFSEVTCLPNYTDFPGFTSFISLMVFVHVLRNELLINYSHRAFSLLFDNVSFLRDFQESVNETNFWNPCIVHGKLVCIINNTPTIYKSEDGRFVCYRLLIVKNHLGWNALIYRMLIEGLYGFALTNSR